MTYQKLICGHEEYRGGHCGHMGCSYYLSNCPLHGYAGTGDTCNLVERARWAWLVEESTFGLEFEVITFHVIVVAKNHELAFNLANHEAEIHTGGKAFLCGPDELVETEDGYLWHYGEAPTGYSVRRLYQVPVWTPPGPVGYQVPNLPDPRSEVKSDV